MLTRFNTGWNDLDDMFSLLNDFRRRVDRAFDDSFGTESGPGTRTTERANWPRANLVDAGPNLVVTAEVPGLTERDVKLMLNQDVLTLAGARKIEAPQGYAAHRRERPDVTFTRSLALPCRVNAERAHAVVKNGILTITLEKSPDAMPREISVSAAG